MLSDLSLDFFERNEGRTFAKTLVLVQFGRPLKLCDHHAHNNKWTWWHRCFVNWPFVITCAHRRIIFQPSVWFYTTVDFGSKTRTISFLSSWSWNIGVSLQVRKNGVDRARRVRQWLRFGTFGRGGQAGNAGTEASRSLRSSLPKFATAVGPAAITARPAVVSNAGRCTAITAGSRRFPPSVSIGGCHRPATARRPQAPTSGNWPSPSLNNERCHFYDYGSGGCSYMPPFQNNIEIMSNGAVGAK